MQIKMYTCADLKLKKKHKCQLKSLIKIHVFINYVKNYFVNTPSVSY